MAQQRTISVKVAMEAQEYFAGLRKMEADTRKASSSAEDAFKRQKAAYDKIGKGALVTSGLFTAATVAMIKSAADFQAKLSQVSALGSEYSKNIGRLSDAAFTAGKAFGLSATQVADAQIELAKAGVSAKDILGGALPGALALAAAGQIDVSKATAIATTAMTQFGLAGAQVPHVADLLAAGADKSIASVDSLGDSLTQSGQVAAQFGLSVEDTVGTLTAFSKAGLNGSDAGTSFKTMLTQLASPTKQAQTLLDKYNITTYDTQGNFVGITALADNLRKGLGDLSQEQRNNALSTIFGNDAIRASGALYDLGGKKLQGFIDANNQAGFATLQASKKLDNLNGDLKKLGAAFQNDLIGEGTAGQGALRGLTQEATGLLDVFGALPAPVQGTALVITGVGAAVTAAGGAFLLLTPRIIAARAAMKDLNITGKGLAAGIGKGGAVALGVTALASGLGNLGSQGELTAQQLNLAGKSAKNGFAGVDKLFDNGGFSNFINGIGSARDALSQISAPLGGGNMAKILDGVSLGITHFSDTYKSAEGQFKAFGEQFAALGATDYNQATSSFNQFVASLGGGADATSAALQKMPAYRDAIVDMLTAAGKAATEQNILAAATGSGGVAGAIQRSQAAAHQNADALKAMSGSAVAANTDISALADTIQGFGSAALDAHGAERAFEAAVDDATTAVKENGQTAIDHGRALDISTAAGRDNQEKLEALAQTAAQSSARILELTGSTNAATAAVRKGRKEFVDQAVQMGLTRDAAKHYADELGLIPADVTTAVGLTGADSALDKAAALKTAMETLDGKKAYLAVYLNAVNKLGVDPTKLSAGLIASGRAGGGAITGTGPKGKDSVLIYAAPGEHVLTAKEVDKLGGQDAVYTMRRNIAAYAAGGAVGDATQAAAGFDRQGDRYDRQIQKGKTDLQSMRRDAAAAQRAYQRASEETASISGEGSGDEKRTAAQHARDLKKNADSLAKRVKNAEDDLGDLRKARDGVRDKQATATGTATTLRQSGEDFVSGQRRATSDNPIDPLSYIDQLRSMSRDDNFSKTRQQTYARAADNYEASLVDLTTKSKAAAETLDTLKSSAASMRSGIVSAISGGFQASSSKLADIVTDDWTELVQSGSKYLEGVQVTTFDEVAHKGGTTAGGFSADAIDAYYAQGSNSTGAFAQDLQALANRGVDGRLLAEIAGYGVEQGAPIAKALLSGTSGQIASINTNYGRIQDNAGMAAGIVTDYNFKALIEDAQANADRITKQIADDGDKLRKLIASAFGITGYAVGTASATPGLHLVGENGPELVTGPGWARFGGGEQVATAARTRQMAAAARTGSSTVGPSSVTIVDVDGTLIGHFSTAARSVARQEIAADQMQDVVLEWGGKA